MHSHTQCVALIALALSWPGTISAQEFDLLPDIQPAEFTVQVTRFASGLPVEQEFVSPVFTQRVGPTDLVEIPNDSRDMIVTTYGGYAFRLDRQGNLAATQFLNLRDEASPSYNANFEIGDAHGLTSLAFHPDFANSGESGHGKFYTLEPEHADSGTHDFTRSTRPGKHHDDVLYEYTLPTATSLSCEASCVASKREVMRVLQPDWHHNLADLAFDTNGLLYIASADGSTSNKSAPFMSDNSQDTSTIFGNILRIDPLGSNSQNGSYGIPDTNPFLADTDKLDEIYAYGFRNPYRISFDSQTGDLFTTDTGEVRIESAYRVTAGGNHGWNLKEGSMVYDKTTKLVTPDIDADNSGVGDVAEAHDLTEPLFEYDRDFGRAIIGTVLYRGDGIPALQGSLVFGDFDGRLFFGDLQTGNEYEFVLDPSSDQLPFQMHSVNQDSDGHLYVLGIQQAGLDFDGIVVRIDSPFSDTDCNANGQFDAGDLTCSCVPDIDAGLAQLGILPGDFNTDGRVAFDDFLILAQQFGSPVSSYVEGDSDCNGTVDFADFLALAQDFGRTSSPANGVPEPGSRAIAVLTALLLVSRLRNRTRRNRARRNRGEDGIGSDSRASVSR